MNRLEVGDGELNALLGRIKRTVAENLLHTADACLVLNQMRRTTVPEHVHKTRVRP